MFRRATTIITSLVLGLAVMAPTALAATSPQTAQANGLKVSPVRTNLSINPGQTKTVPIYIADPTNSPIELQVFVNDFTANGDSGSPHLILNAPNNYPHGLANFIAPIKNITLSPNQQAIVNVAITIPKGTAGGGYYAAVRFAPINSNNTQNLTLTANVASLILVSVPGPGLNPQLNIDSLNISRSGSKPSRLFFSRNDLSASVKFSNSGNVQEEPFGKIIVQSGDKTILSEAINNSVSPGSVLPDNTRLFSVPLSNLGWFGKYKVSGYFGYGSAGKLLSISTTIYVIDSWFIGLALAVILVIALLVWVVIRQQHKRIKTVHNTQSNGE